MASQRGDRDQSRTTGRGSYRRFWDWSSASTETPCGKLPCDVSSSARDAPKASVGAGDVRVGYLPQAEGCGDGGRLMDGYARAGRDHQCRDLLFRPRVVQARCGRAVGCWCLIRTRSSGLTRAFVSGGWPRRGSRPRRGSTSWSCRRSHRGKSLAECTAGESGLRVMCSSGWRGARRVVVCGRIDRAGHCRRCGESPSGMKREPATRQTHRFVMRDTAFTCSRALW